MDKYDWDYILALFLYVGIIFILLGIAANIMFLIIIGLGAALLVLPALMVLRNMFAMRKRK